MITSDELTLDEIRLLKKYETRANSRMRWSDTRDFVPILLIAKKNPTTLPLSSVDGETLTLEKVIGIKTKVRGMCLVATTKGRLIERETGYRKEWESMQVGDYLDDQTRRYCKAVIDPFVNVEILSRMVFDVIIACRQTNNGLTWNDPINLVSQVIASSVVACIPAMQTEDIIESFLVTTDPPPFFSRTIVANRIPLSVSVAPCVNIRYCSPGETIKWAVYSAVSQQVTKIGNSVLRSEYEDIINSYELSTSIREMTVRFLRSRRSNGAGGDDDR